MVAASAAEEDSQSRTPPAPASSRAEAASRASERLSPPKAEESCPSSHLTRRLAAETAGAGAVCAAGGDVLLSEGSAAYPAAANHSTDKAASGASSPPPTRFLLSARQRFLQLRGGEASAAKGPAPSPVPALLPAALISRPQAPLALLESVARGERLAGVERTRTPVTAVSSEQSLLQTTTQSPSRPSPRLVSAAALCREVFIREPSALQQPRAGAGASVQSPSKDALVASLASTSGLLPTRCSTNAERDFIAPAASVSASREVSAASWRPLQEAPLANAGPSVASLFGAAKAGRPWSRFSAEAKGASERQALFTEPQGGSSGAASESASSFRGAVRTSHESTGDPQDAAGEPSLPLGGGAAGRQQSSLQRSVVIFRRLLRSPQTPGPSVYFAGEGAAVVASSTAAGRRDDGSAPQPQPAAAASFEKQVLASSVAWEDDIADLLDAADVRPAGEGGSFSLFLSTGTPGEVRGDVWGVRRLTPTC